jgi:hypothetical protein
MKPEDKAVVQQVRKYLVPGAIVPVDVPTTQLLLRVLRQLLEQPAPVQEPVEMREVLVKIARFLGVVRVYAQDIQPKNELETDKPLHWKARELQDEVIRLLDTTPPAQPAVQDKRLKVKLGSQYGHDLNGHWFYLQPADEFAEAALYKHTGVAAPQPADHSEQDLYMVDHGDELTIAYLDGVHTGKKIAKRDLLNALERLLVVQDELCSIDHHGYCQSHYLDNVNSHGGCRVANARALVAKVRGKP